VNVALGLKKVVNPCLRHFHFNLFDIKDLLEASEPSLKLNKKNKKFVFRVKMDVKLSPKRRKFHNNKKLKMKKLSRKNYQN
jgi:hypothetical protein